MLMRRDPDRLSVVLDEGDKHLKLTFSTKHLQPFKNDIIFITTCTALNYLWKTSLSRLSFLCTPLGGNHEKCEPPGLKSQGIFPRTHWHIGHNLLLDFTNILDVGSFASTHYGIPVFSPLLVEEVLAWNSFSII